MSELVSVICPVCEWSVELPLAFDVSNVTHLDARIGIEEEPAQCENRELAYRYQHPVRETERS